MSQKAIFAHARGRTSEPDHAQKTISIGISSDGDVSRTAVLLTETEVADWLRVSLACLRRWRLERRGPRF
jgi:hypothetical protein